MHLRLFPWINAEDISSLLRHVDYAYTALYTHNYKEFQSITRKIEPGYPKNNYACNTLAIVPVRMLCAGLVETSMEARILDEFDKAIFSRHR